MTDVANVIDVTDDALLAEIRRRLALAVPARSRIVLFGSRAAGNATRTSDVDLLVIEPTVDDPMEESVRLRRSLKGLGVPIDVIVIDEQSARRRAAVRGTVVERALRDGRILVDI